MKTDPKLIATVRLLAERHGHGHIAQVAGVSRKDLARWLTGKRNPGAANRAKLMKVVQKFGRTVASDPSGPAEKETEERKEEPRRKRVRLEPVSRRFWRGRGYYVETVQQYVHHARRYRDLFGCIDLVAFSFGKPPVFIQVTSKGNMSARKEKMRTKCVGQGTDPYPIWKIVLALLETGNRVIVEGWQKVGGRWQVRIDEAVLSEREPEGWTWHRRC